MSNARPTPQPALPQPGPSLPRAQLGLVFAVLLVTAAGNTALQSVLPVIGRAIGIADMAIAVIFSLSALFWTVSAPFWARQSDRRGRRMLINVGLGGFTVSMMLCALVILAGLAGLLTAAATFILFTLARALFGIFGAAANPAAQAFVAQRTTPEERTGVLALLASAFGLGTILGPALAPFFVLPGVGLSGPMFAFALIAAGVIVAVRLGLPDDRPAQGALGGAAAAMPHLGAPPSGASARAGGAAPSQVRLRLSDRRVRPFLWYGLAVGSMQAATAQALGFLIIDRLAASPIEATRLIGVALMAGAAATLMAQWGLIRLLDLTPSQLMRWGALVAAAGLGILALGGNFHQITIGFALASAGFGFARPGFTAGSSLAVQPEEQGQVAGQVTSVNGACFILAPAAGIGLYQVQPELPYALATIGCLWAAAYAWRVPALRQSRP